MYALVIVKPNGLKEILGPTDTEEEAHEWADDIIFDRCEIFKLIPVTENKE